jgi:hypothetical protein
MQFPGYWVEDTDGKVIIHTAIFDETELDPKTDWKEAWQNQDASSPVKGFMETGKDLAHAARLIARNQGRDISDVEILTLQSAPALFKDGQCELNRISLRRCHPECSGGIFKPTTQNNSRRPCLNKKSS